MGATSRSGPPRSYAREVLGSALIMAWSLPHVVLQVYTHEQLGGSVIRLWRALRHGSVYSAVAGALAKHGTFSFKLTACFMLFEAALQLLLPGRRYNGPKTLTGHVPQYYDNGLLAYAVTMFTAWLVTSWVGWFDVGRVYDSWLSTVVVLNAFAMLWCTFLYVKGRVAPSSTDNEFHNRFVVDFYRGIELYPRLFNGRFDLKMFTNCRLGMMAWPLLCVAFALKQRQMFGHVSNSMLLSVMLQVVYCAKFFWWEEGYMSSMDIMHDRGGYYICWGCLCFLPSTYTAATFFLTRHPYNYSPAAFAVLLALGLAFIFTNYWADLQRQRARATDGKCLVWGAPAKVLRAKHTQVRDGRREEKQSLLLYSGFWGVSRHFHYVPEILAAVCWCAPFSHALLLPYFYPIFLTILLLDRAHRDDVKCRAKYGKSWDEYCRLVPYKVIPYVY